MIDVHEEVLLVAFAIALYVYDSSSLLFANEAILSRNRSEWSIWIGSEASRFLGKYLFVPNPLAPHRPIYRLLWSSEARPPTTACTNPESESAKYKLLGLMVHTMGFALFVLLPIGLLSPLVSKVAAVSTAVLLFYASAFLSLAWIWTHRRLFLLTDRAAAALAFECLACPPFAVNLVRRLSLATTIDDDLIDTAQRLLAPERWEQLAGELLAKLSDDIDAEEVGTERMAVLQRRRTLLMQKRLP